MHLLWATMVIDSNNYSELPLVAKNV